MALSDGERVVPLASSQDHKRALDGDRGPNTGGMGAYSPAPVVTGDRAQQIMETIVQPVVRGMAAAGTPYRGLLYAGLMIHGDDIQVLEINCRFGDPETQPVLMRLEDDLVTVLRAAARGELPETPLRTDPRATLCVVMAAGGYPGSYAKGEVIQGLAEADAEDVQVFHAGTALDAQGRVVTAGGRVLGVTAYGETIAAARDRAYEAASRITWRDVHYRKDIGHRAL
jgi:phosphoribosylamine--glycine ligase